MAVDFNDIKGEWTLPVLRDRIEEIVQENLVYRDVFRNYDATGINSNIVQIPVPKDEMGKPKIVDEGAEFPRTHEEYELKELEFDKFGFEIPITMEAKEDSRAGLADDQLTRQSREMAEDINLRAFEEINATLVDEHNRITSDSGDTGNADGTMSYDDVLAGRRDLIKSSYNPDLLIADVDAVHDLMKSNNFLEASEMQGEMRRAGAVGRIAGMTIVEDDSGLDITGTGNPGALMVDTSYFGYEGLRDPITTEEYTETRSQTDVYRTFARMGWLVTEPQSGIVVEG